MSIYNTAVNKPISTLMVFLAIIVLGVASYIQLPVDQYPKMDPPYITVMATYPGANAADIEENVTKILENQLNSVDDLKELTSTSYDNLSVISLEFEWEVNLDEASNDVRDAVDNFTLANILRQWVVVFFGNWIGGGIFIGLAYSWLNKTKTPHID